RRVVVVAGGSLAKLGMKCRGHLAAGYPLLEDVLVGAAIDVAADDGRSPFLRVDTAAVHRIADGTAPHQMAQVLTVAPLRAAGLALGDVDRYAVELHNPDITEPAGSGDVPARNYQIIAALAAQAGEIARSEIPAFAEAHGMPGFSPTQGHIASAIAYLPHAVAGGFGGTSAGAMDLEEQGRIQQLVEGGGRDRMVVLLGTPNASSTLMIALTLTQGDPSYAGPLAGVPLGLPVYHILEEEVKE